MAELCRPADTGHLIRESVLITSTATLISFSSFRSFHNITTTDQPALTDIIAHARRVDLAFENHRWHDLVRTGKAVDVMNAFGVKQKQLYGYLPAASYQVDKNKLLYPIPQSERELNVDLTQNDGYPQ